jgi:hypothetical protein
VFFDREERVREAFLFALVTVRNRDVPVFVAVVVDNLLLEIADDDNELLGTKVDELIETMRQKRFAVDFDISLWFVFSKGSESRPLPCCGHYCFHQY